MAHQPWLDQHDRHVADWIDFWMHSPKPPDELTAPLRV
jgi:hypothetical protein